jgi:hypothetical protein
MANLAKPNSWKEVFNSNLKHWGWISIACDKAKECGYKYFWWNGKIWDVETHRDVCTEDEIK